MMRSGFRKGRDDDMFFTVIINNYNYGRFLREAVDSVLSQDHGHFRLIIVDDGSTDDSAAVMDAVDDSRVVKICKRNGGQLSCLNAAMPRLGDGVACFLDADDRYEPGYLAALERAYADTGCDFAFCNMAYFGARRGAYHREGKRVFIADSYYLTLHQRKWIGGPTSSLSMRTEILRAFMPLPELEKDWRWRADDVLIWGASLCRASKLYLPEAWVGYRIHDSNHHFNQETRRLAAAAFFRRFARPSLARDFAGIIAEFRRSPLPIQYKSLLLKILFLPGYLWSVIRAKRRYYPRLFKYRGWFYTEAT